MTQKWPICTHCQPSQTRQTDKNSKFWHPKTPSTLGLRYSEACSHSRTGTLCHRHPSQDLPGGARAGRNEGRHKKCVVIRRALPQRKGLCGPITHAQSDFFSHGNAKARWRAVEQARPDAGSILGMCQHRCQDDSERPDEEEHATGHIGVQRTICISKYPIQNHIPHPLYLLESRHRKPSLCASMWACVLRAPRRVDPRPRSRPRHEPPRKAAIRPNPKCTSHATSFRPHWACDSWSGFVWSTPVSFPPAEETARSGPSSNHPGFA